MADEHQDVNQLDLEQQNPPANQVNQLPILDQQAAAAAVE